MVDFFIYLIVLPIFNTKEYYEKFDSMLKDIDEEYGTTLINFGKYKLTNCINSLLHLQLT